MTADYPCTTCPHIGIDMMQEPCAHCADYRDYIARCRPIVNKADRIVDSPYTGSDLPDIENEMERLLWLLQIQYNRINDHLAQIAGELYHIRESGLSVTVTNGDIIDGRDRP